MVRELAAGGLKYMFKQCNRRKGNTIVIVLYNFWAIPEYDLIVLHIHIDLIVTSIGKHGVCQYQLI